MLVAGASGFVGGRLLAEAALEGVETAVLRRDARGLSGGTHAWDPAAGRIDPACLQNVDTIVNLCGAGIADRRWTRARRQLLRESRLLPTRTLVSALGRDGAPPGRVLINASAIGFYGDRGDELLAEGAAQGGGFLADLCAEWEAEALAARRAGVRVVLLRLGIVLGGGGGALSRMATPFRLGLGGPLGDGQAWMSWISLEDLCRVILFAARSPVLEGPVNAVAPEPVRNTDFTRALAAALGRRALLPMPAAVLRLLFGEMAREALLASTRVRPALLEAQGFSHRHRALGPFLADLYRR
jgi:uncharacterized protein (TIGR01777 family)